MTGGNVTIELLRALIRQSLPDKMPDRLAVALADEIATGLVKRLADEYNRMPESRK